MNKEESKIMTNLLDNDYCFFIESDTRGVCIEVSKIGDEPDTMAYCKTFIGKTIDEVISGCLLVVAKDSEQEG